MTRTPRQSTERAHDWDQDKLNHVRRALRQSGFAVARVQGMKARAISEPPTQIAIRPFPYPGHRTCAQWTRFEAMTERRDGQ
jgi:hypothetical protein